ncbi:hypothetical protein VP1G_10653 [Cytospora mali]|uniref:F-box domain-containing protein n=1 Tax=Cytospora mali TaxID=578113 RepID=A0A194URH4_CYTMA|nr:hypothetical protein VP1G_10653 [Valsa mali var. pyri (nom. inval.)]
MEVEILLLRNKLRNSNVAQAEWRRLHGEDSLPKIRRLKISNLPIEVLTLIFNHVKHEPATLKLDNSYLHNNPRPDFDLTSIQSIRMTCRHFYNASSSLLIPVVHVSITPNSLARLNKASRNPTISRGVRTIRTHANIYSAEHAGNYQAFCQSAVQKLLAATTAYRGYEKRYNEQKALLDNDNFFYIVSIATARMPMQQVSFTDLS